MNRDSVDCKKGLSGLQEGTQWTARRDSVDCKKGLSGLKKGLSGLQEGTQWTAWMGEKEQDDTRG
jgi:hypothetical protein